MMQDFITLDVEATGVDPAKDRIIQVGIVAGGETRCRLINPGRPIPPEVTELTGIADADVANAPKFADVAKSLAELVAGKPIVTFGGLRFDIPLLAEEFARAGVDVEFGPVIDAGNLFKLHYQRRLLDAVRTYLGPTAAAEFEAKAHDAAADAAATSAVFSAQYNLGQFPDLSGKTLDEVALLSAYGKTPADPFGKLIWIDGRVCYGTFKNHGVAIADDPGYAEWMLNRGDFPMATRRVLQRELDKIYPPDQGSLFDDA